VQALILLAWWWEGPEGMFCDFLKLPQRLRMS
jgi:hypothetical protein